MLLVTATAVLASLLGAFGPQGARAQTDDDDVWEYAVACPPSHLANGSLSACSITLLASDRVYDVEVRTQDSVQLVTLEQDEPLKLTFNETFLPRGGLENIGIIITSDIELQVLVSKDDLTPGTSKYIDSYVVFDERFAWYEYFVLTRTEGCSSSDYNKAYYTVTALYDETWVEIYNLEQFESSILLNRFQTYTVRTTNSTIEYSGFRIEMTEPALVYTGSACTDVREGYGKDGSYMTSLQPTRFYGDDYITPVIRAPELSGYGLRIMAAEDDTDVSHEGTLITLAKGEFVQKEDLANNLATRVTCSKPCLAIMYSLAASTYPIGNFMFNILGLSQFTQQARFVTNDVSLDGDAQHSVCIVVYGAPPMDDVFLDGNSLGDVTWSIRGPYLYTTLDIAPGFHLLETTDPGKNFSAYVYGHSTADGGGYGFSVYPHDVEVEPLPTLPPPTPDPGATFEYAVACTPSADVGNGCTVTIVTMDTSALVTISTSEDEWQELVNATEPLVLDFDGPNFQTTSGFEKKGILIVSDTELTVTVENFGDTVHWDKTQAYSLETAGFDHYVLGNPNTGSASPNHINEFYVVVGHWPGTRVRIFDNDAERTLKEAIVLGRHDVFTTLTTSNTTTYAGRYINSNYPVSVYSGTGCLGGGTGAYMTSLPPIIHYSTNFVAPSLTLPSQPAITTYGLVVVAAWDNTVVTYEEQNVTLDTSQTRSLEFTWSDLAAIVTCSKPCLVMQNSIPVAGSVNGYFLQNVIPVDQYYTTAVFSTDDESDGQHYVSIVVNGVPPMGDVFLDGESLGDKTWKIRGNTTYIDLPVSPDQHEVTTTSSDKTFAVYVYSHNSARGAYGYPVWPQGSLIGSTGSPTTPPTTTTARPPVDLPIHQFVVNGTAYTESGANIVTECVAGYQKQMELRSQRTAVVMEREIGRTLCTFLDPGYLSFSNIGVSTSVDGDKLFVGVEYSLAQRWLHYHLYVDICATELLEFVQNQTNWDQPIIPEDDETGCEGLDFYPERFDRFAQLWRCQPRNLPVDVEQNDEGKPLADNTLFQEAVITQEFVTSDGSSLGPVCNSRYLQEARDECALRVDMVNDFLPSVGCAGALVAVNCLEAFSSDTDQAFLSLRFLHAPGNGTFFVIDTCITEVETFISNHDNWEPNILPQPDGCPAIEPTEGMFTREGSAWICENSDTEGTRSGSIHVDANGMLIV